MNTKIKRWRCPDECPVACWIPDHKPTAWNPIFAGVGACWHLPLQSLARQEGGPHPLWCWAFFLRPLEVVDRAVSIPIWMGSLSYTEHGPSPCPGMTCCSLQPLGRGVQGTPVLLPSPVWQCLTAPARLCSALGQLCLPCCNLPLCAVDPCRIPSIQSLLDFVPSRKSCSGFLELRHISLNQNCCFLGSCDAVKIVWLFFSFPCNLNEIMFKNSYEDTVSQILSFRSVLLWDLWILVLSYIHNKLLDCLCFLLIC